MTSKEASAKMEKIAKLAADESDKIFEVHNKEVAEVKRLLEHQIQWYQRGALGELHDVLKKATDTCNKRYVSLQSLVQMVDSECKPLLAFQPYKKSIKAVAQVIADLNEDSVLNTDFGLSIDSGDMEDVAMVSYSPSLDALMIQKFWEQKVLVVDETPEEREILKVEREEQRKRDEEARKAKKEETERKRKEAEEKKLRQKSAVETAIKKREDHIALLKAECDKKIKNLEKTVQDLQNQLMKENAGDIAKKEKLENELKSLGFFKFSEKKELKEKVEAISKQISDRGQKLANLNAQYQKDKFAAQSEYIKEKTEFDRIKKVVRAKVGEEISYGTQFYDKGKPMQWLVVSVSDDEIKLLAKHTVENSSFRAAQYWLENKFVKEVFSEKEKNTLKKHYGKVEISLPTASEVMRGCGRMGVSPEDGLVKWIESEAKREGKEYGYTYEQISNDIKHDTERVNAYWLNGYEEGGFADYVSSDCRVGKIGAGAKFGVRPMVAIDINEYLKNL